MQKLNIAKHYRLIDATANLFIQTLPVATNAPNGHIETCIAGAAIMTGVLVLGASGVDLSKFSSGTVLVTGNWKAQEPIVAFMMNVAKSMGLEWQNGWDTPIPKEHEPLVDPLELGHELALPFLQACAQTRIPKEYYPYAAAFAAVKLVGAGYQTRALDLDIGKGLAATYFALGTKLVL